MKNAGTQSINTKRLFLRRITIDDAQAMFNNWACNAEVTKYMRWKAHRDIETTKFVINLWLKEYDSNDVYRWGIVYKENGELIGAIDVVSPDKVTQSAQIGYCLSKMYWNKGIMTESLKEVINYLFSKTDIKKTESWHHIDNQASGKVMLKSGMQFKEIKKDGDKDNNGNLCTIAVYELLKAL
ncbi:MAG: GNAT family N-acetyltransferase [Endomicrobium sp.]|jgi:ribosomal-protein-alanine N-acetyltransferase|nr:GNAT family N-acetyltransferase [Endomicrobium sp.]